MCAVYSGQGSSSMHPRNRNSRGVRAQAGWQGAAHRVQKRTTRTMPTHYAVSLLARRDYSSVELTPEARRNAGTSSTPSKSWSTTWSAMNKVNDERYGQNVVAYRARRGHGPARIRHQLQKSGLDRAGHRRGRERRGSPGLPGAGAGRSGNANSARTIPKDRKERARQARFLQYRGFSTDHIRAVLEGDPEVDSDPDADSEPDQS